MAIFSKIRNTDSDRALKRYRPLVQKINDLGTRMESLQESDYAQEANKLKDRYKEGESLDELLPEAFALVREISKRTTGLRHFDVQLMGGIALHEGNIAEMRTGEGKTLAATLPTFLHALTGKGVHVITVNDYLARRDAVWMGQIYAALGMSVGVIGSQNESFLYDAGHSEKDAERDALGSFKVAYDFLRPCTKSEAYSADITYGTNNEFGFDYLRDNIAYRKEDLVQREPHYAIIDEIDSILIDEARTPLIISAPTEDAENLYTVFAGVAQKLRKDEHYEVDEKQKAITLTDSGIELAEKLLGVENIYTEKGIKYVHHLETAVRAKALFQRDKEYVVRDDGIIIVDQFTGRLMPGRRWSEGLHQAIEAKEGVTIERESRTYASITFQNYFRLYSQLSGMTGTATTSAEEFYKVYGLQVIEIPTNKPVIRKDLDDLIFQNEQGKLKALAKAVRGLQEKGQPVLIGTVSIEDNEKLSQYLKREGVTHEVLNAKNHEREGEIVARAGGVGSVTVATNMAGRGVDIKLGGVDPKTEDHEKVVELGGLYVIGTERHDARRIDNQLRGRSGRQGDPGETRFYVSLEDKLMRVFATDTVKGIMEKLNIPDDQPIENRIITRSLEAAQKKIEGLNFDSRKHVLEYDNVLNTQRLSVYERRRKVLLGDIEDILDILDEFSEGDSETEQLIQEKIDLLGEEEFAKVAQRMLLQTIDLLWVEHLELMDYTRSSVNLRAYGQRDPLVEYKKEGIRLFREMEEAIRDQVLKLIPNIGEGAFVREGEKLRAVHASAGNIGDKNNGNTPRPAISKKKPGRNELVTITNGKETKEMKYKKAESLLSSGEWRVI